MTIRLHSFSNLQQNCNQIKINILKNNLTTKHQHMESGHFHETEMLNIRQICRIQEKYRIGKLGNIWQLSTYSVTTGCLEYRWNVRPKRNSLTFQH